MVKPDACRKKNISGDDIITVLAYAEDRTKRILEGGFRVLFGVEWKEWDTATAEMKKKLLNKGLPPLSRVHK
jgi:hypothetical protein